MIQHTKIGFAYNSIQERGGYCLVESQSEAKPHIVTVNERLYSTNCTCKASKQGMDCYHRLVVDRHYDEQRSQMEREEREYQIWKKLNGLDRQLSREEYDAVFSPNGY